MKFFRKQIFQRWLSCYVGSKTSTAMVAHSYDPLIFDSTNASVRKFKGEEIDIIMSTTSTIIGEGGFSTVYLAHIGNSSCVPAAFKVNRCSERLNQAFRQELDILLHLNHHPNIARLLGYCDERDKGAVLVLEYVSNGTLHESLHEITRRPDNVLTWSNRTAIAFQLAVALDYLHEGCGLQIVHGDIKASNILLDGNNRIKVCDFGSARMGFSGAVIVRSSNLIMGSPGYVDPYYMRTGLISNKCDVYSFGVVLLELVTGMEAFCSDEQQLLTAVVRERLRGGMKGSSVEELLVDPRLKREFDFGEVSMMVQIAQLCTEVDQPCLRPSMSQVLRIMKEKKPSSSIPAME